MRARGGRGQPPEVGVTGWSIGSGRASEFSSPPSLFPHELGASYNPIERSVFARLCDPTWGEVRYSPVGMFSRWEIGGNEMVKWFLHRKLFHILVESCWEHPIQGWRHSASTGVAADCMRFVGTMAAATCGWRRICNSLMVKSMHTRP